MTRDWGAVMAVTLQALAEESLQGLRLNLLAEVISETRSEILCASSLKNNKILFLFVLFPPKNLLPF